MARSSCRTATIVSANAHDDGVLLSLRRTFCFAFLYDAFFRGCLGGLTCERLCCGFSTTKVEQDGGEGLSCFVLGPSREPQFLSLDKIEESRERTGLLGFLVAEIAMFGPNNFLLPPENFQTRLAT